MTHGKRRVRRGRASTTTDLGQLLTHSRALIDGQQYFIEGRLDQRRDRSFTLLATDIHKREVVIRTFDRESKALEELGRFGRVSGQQVGLANYEGAGSWTFNHPQLRHGRNDSVQLHGIVRQYQAKTLKDLAAEELSYVTAAQMITDVAKGLHRLHEAGVVHADLKPGNVLITPEGRALVADYGIAQLARETRPHGELQYLAPEGAASKEADVFAFGKLLSLIKGDRRKPAGEVEDRLQHLIEICLSKDPGERPTIDGVLDLLVPPDKRHHVLFGELIAPALADIGLRTESPFAANDLMEVRGEVALLADLLEDEANSVGAYRLRAMRPSQRVHLLASASFLTGRWFSASSEKKQGDRLATYFDLPAAWQRRPIGDAWVKDIERQFQELSHADLEEIAALAEVLPASVISAMRGPASDAELQREVRLRVGLATEARNALLLRDGYLRSEAVASLLSGSCPQITVEEVRTLRDSGFLMSVNFDGIELYPKTQFQQGRGYLPFECIRSLKEVFGDDLASSWALLSWWFRDSYPLSLLSPSQFLSSGGDQGLVVRAAHELDVA